MNLRGHHRTRVAPAEIYYQASWKLDKCEFSPYSCMGSTEKWTLQSDFQLSVVEITLSNYSNQSQQT